MLRILWLFLFVLFLAPEVKALDQKHPQTSETQSITISDGIDPWELSAVTNRTSFKIRVSLSSGKLFPGSRYIPFSSDHCRFWGSASSEKLSEPVKAGSWPFSQHKTFLAIRCLRI